MVNRRRNWMRTEPFVGRDRTYYGNGEDEVPCDRPTQLPDCEAERDEVEQVARERDRKQMISDRRARDRPAADEEAGNLSPRDALRSTMRQVPVSERGEEDRQ